MLIPRSVSDVVIGDVNHSLIHKQKVKRMHFEKFMFAFWHIPTTWAFIVSAIIPIMFLSEGILRGVILDNPLMTLTVVVVPFYLVNGFLKVVDDFL